MRRGRPWTGAGLTGAHRRVIMRARGNAGSPSAGHGTRIGGHMQTPAPFGYERATSVEHAVACSSSSGPRPGSSPAATPAADDEAAPGPARAPHRHQRPRRRARLHPGRRRRAAHRRDVPARRAARLGRRRRALPDPPRRRAGDRRPDRAQPWHRRRLALPGRPGRRPVGRFAALGPTVVIRRLAGTRTVPVREFHVGPTRRSSGPPRCSPRSACRSARAAAAPTRRSSGASATGRLPPPAPACGWTATRSPTSASVSPPSAPSTSARRRPRTSLRGQTATDEVIAAAGDARRRAQPTRPPTNADPPTTSGTSPAS